jgi:hypothetical protein
VAFTVRLVLSRGGNTLDVIAGIAVEYGEFFKKEEIEWLIENSLVKNSSNS